jgi:hypothetical protein
MKKIAVLGSGVRNDWDSRRASPVDPDWTRAAPQTAVRMGSVIGQERKKSKHVPDA